MRLAGKTFGIADHKRRAKIGKEALVPRRLFITALQ
jgi:hypothetical protein